MTLTTRTVAIVGAAVLVAGCSSAKPAASSAPAGSASVSTSATTSSPSSGDASSSSASVSASASPSESASAATGGGDLASMKGQEVMNLVAKAVRAAGSGRAKGTMSTGLSGASGPVTLVFNGTTSQITLTYKGSTVDLISAPSGTYIKAPLALWTAQSVPAKLAKTIAGHWVMAPASAGAGDSTMTADGLAKEFENPTDGTVLDAVTTSTYAGKRVVVVKKSTGSFVDIATDGSNLPVYIENAGTDGGKLTFSDFGKTVTITIPTNAIDLSTLVPGN